MFSTTCKTINKYLKGNKWVKLTPPLNELRCLSITALPCDKDFIKQVLQKIIGKLKNMFLGKSILSVTNHLSLYNHKEKLNQKLLERSKR